jgi:tetratricopeptide (TPR) repeat protein
MDPDLLEGYLEARRELQELAGAHPRLRPALGGLALADAHLATRFGADPALGAEAKRLADQALAEGASPSARVALSLLAIHASDPKLAATNLAAVPEQDRGWHHHLASFLAAIAVGEPDRARALLDRSTPPAAALLLAAARLHHRDGERELAAATAARGLAVSPQHPGLRLLALLAAPVPDAAALDALEPAARAVPRYRTALALARALAAEHRGALGEARRLVVAALESDPKDPHAATHTARLLSGAGGDLPRAIELLTAHASAQQPAVRLRVAGLLLRAGRPHEARRLLDGIGAAKLAASDREIADALRVRAATLAEDASAVDRLCAPSGVGANRGAILFCAEARADQPSTIEALARRLPPGPERAYLAGLRSLALGDTAAATAQLSRVARLEIDPAAPLLALGRVRVRAGDHVGAIAILRKAVALDAGAARARTALATSLSAAGSRTEALPMLEAIAKERPTQPSLVAAIGESYLSLGKPDRVQVLIDSVQAQAGTSIALRLLAGKVALADRRPVEARDHFKAVLLRDAKNADALIELGRIETAAGNDEAARRHFQAALRQRPRDTGLLLAVARAHAHSGNYRKALDSGMSSIRLLKRTGQEAQAQEAMVELGRLLAPGDKWAKTRAAELFFEATKPKDAPAAPFFELGRLYRQQNDLARTVWCFRQAVQRSPSHAEAYLELGMALRAKPQWRRDAKQALRHYLRLRPDGSEAARVRALLARMR